MTALTMRRLMTLMETSTVSEGDAPFIWPEKAYELISSYVTHGSMQQPDEFDTEFDQLWELLARSRSSKTLFRVLRLDPHLVAELELGNPVDLQPRRYSSWTRSQSAVERLMYGRRREGQTLVVIQVQLPGKDVLVDIVDFYKRYKLNTPDFEEWSRYVWWEQEVIVRHNGPLRITPSMIIEIEPYTTPQKVAPPPPGTSFVSFSGKKDRIKRVITAEPDHVFSIITRDGDPASVRQTQDGQWLELHP